MAAKDADIASDYAERSLFLSEASTSIFEVALVAVNQETELANLYLVNAGALSATAAVDSFPAAQPSQKSQFLSTEDLEITLNPFSGASGSYLSTGLDVVTLTLKAPDGTIFNPVATWDADVSMWVAQLPALNFQEGEWLLYAVSDAVDSLPQFMSLWWGDYVDDIAETRQAALGRWKIEGAVLRLYEADGVTVFREFNLRDSGGDPTDTNIFDKDPV